MGTQRGWTLIELMIVAGVVAVVLGVATPALSGAMEGARAASVRSDLATSLLEGSTRAALTGNRAVLCPSLDGQNCSDDADWTPGWLVFMDPNANREQDGGERVLRKHAPLPGRVHLRSSSGRTRIVFQGSGGNAGSNVTFTVCDGRGAARAATLVLANDGRLRPGVADPNAIALACPR
jgi:type IV fimbrial biogenesis protein FimT